MGCVEKDHNDHLVSTPLLCAGLPATRPGCPAYCLYARRQGPQQFPSEFWDKFRDTVRRQTPLEPGSEVGIQPPISLFIGQPASDTSLQKAAEMESNSRNLGSGLQSWIPHAVFESSPVSTGGRLETADRVEAIGSHQPLNCSLEPSSVISADTEKEKFCQPKKELEECERDSVSSPFPKSNSINPSNTCTYPLREVPVLSGDIGCVNSPLPSEEERHFEREMKSLMKDPTGLAEQFDHFLVIFSLQNVGT